MRHLWLVEDDGKIIDQLKSSFEGELGLAVTPIRSEEEFHRDYEGLARSNPPSIIILDMMLRWTRRIPVMVPPIGCSDEQRAGLRCRKLIAESRSLSRAIVVFYTHLTRTEIDFLGLRDPFLTKCQGNRNLIELVKQKLGGGDRFSQTAYRA